MGEGGVFGVASEFFWNLQAQAWTEFADRGSWGDYLDSRTDTGAKCEARHLSALEAQLPLQWRRASAATCLLDRLSISNIPVEPPYTARAIATSFDARAQSRRRSAHARSRGVGRRVPARANARNRIC